MELQRALEAQQLSYLALALQGSTHLSFFSRHLWSCSVPVAALATVPQRAYSPHWLVQASAHLQLPIDGRLKQGDDLLGCNPSYPLWAPGPASSFCQLVPLGCLPSCILLPKAAIVCFLPPLPYYLGCLCLLGHPREPRFNKKV